ncbi:hypothetical protein DRQ17_07170 [bacterium]|nr:MAG: hypothetical protein DRQ17_07170 [bacterium]RKZ22940.1 MAG: hypothetical protein DRQ23_04030 [bacterium]
MILILISTVAGIVNQGNKFFREGKYDTALSYYNQAELLSPENPVIKFNKGVALYKLGRMDEAEKSLLGALKTKNPVLKQRTFYNLGNTYYKMGKLDNAIKSYISALKLNPFDKEAKKNLEMCLKQKKQNKSKNNKKEKNKNQQKNEKQKPKEKKQNGDVKQQLQAVQNELKKLLKKNIQKKKGKGGGSVRDW